jgi:hypothetical protein
MRYTCLLSRCIRNIKMMKFIITASLVGHSFAHSWADNVGGGSYRAAQGANDLIKQRYHCPLASLDQCQPPSSSGVVLTAESQRPCRTDFPTPSWGSGIAGQPMYVHWAGNGHTGAKGAGTCVSIYIAPYAADPNFSSFRQLASCLPFSHDADITDAYVTLPADLASGQYTVFWVWDFTPFWFSSCSDINVVGSSGPATTSRPQTTAAQTTVAPQTSVTTSSLRTTTVAVTTQGPATTRASTQAGSSAVDCKSYDKPNAVCQSLYGASSYCVSWVMDKCGRSSCFGAPPSDVSKC